MTTRDFTRLVIILVVLLIVLLIFANPFKGPVRGSDGGAALFPSLASAQPEIIQVSGKNDVNLWMEGGEWLVSGDFVGELYPADTASVNRALRSARDADDLELVSRNPEKRSIFEVDSTGALVRIMTADSTALAEFRIGKAGTDYATNYVRHEGSDEVYVVGERIKSHFDRPWRGFRDMYLLKIEKDDISRLDLKREDADVSMQRQDDGSWALMTPEEGRVKDSYADRLINTVANFRGDDFAKSDSLSMGFDTPFVEAVIVLKDGSERTIQIADFEHGVEISEDDPAAGRRYVRLAGSRWTYLVGKYRLETLTKPYDEMLEPPPANPDSMGVETTVTTE